MCNFDKHVPVHENRECEQVVTEHLQFMVANGIDVKAEHKALPSFYWLPKYNLMESVSLQH